MNECAMSAWESAACSAAYTKIHFSGREII